MPGFFSNVFKLTTGTMIAQVVGILLIPVVTRVYPPSSSGSPNSSSPLQR